MRGYDEYDTAPLDQPDHAALTAAIDNAGPVDPSCASNAHDIDIDLVELPF
jgi:hypothetical protein